MNSCCGKEMIWVQFAWDIDKYGVMVSFGWYKCQVCNKTIGSREDFSERYFKIPNTIKNMDV